MKKETSKFIGCSVAFVFIPPVFTCQFNEMGYFVNLLYCLGLWAAFAGIMHLCFYAGAEAEKTLRQALNIKDDEPIFGNRAGMSRTGYDPEDEDIDPWEWEQELLDEEQAFEEALHAQHDNDWLTHTLRQYQESEEDDEDTDEIDYFNA